MLEGRNPTWPNKLRSCDLNRHVTVPLIDHRESTEVSEPNPRAAKKVVALINRIYFLSCSRVSLQTTLSRVHPSQPRLSVYKLLPIPFFERHVSSSSEPVQTVFYLACINSLIPKDMLLLLVIASGLHFFNHP